MKQKNQRYFLQFFQKLNDNFSRDAKKKIDKRKSRTVISNKKSQQIRKNMERTRQQHDARRKKQEITTYKGRVPKRRT